jgi:hypothetical protein
MFVRPMGDIEKTLSKMPKLPTQKQIDRMRNCTYIKENKYDLEDMTKFENLVAESSAFVKKVLPQMKLMKKNLHLYMTNNHIAIVNQK